MFSISIAIGLFKRNTTVSAVKGVYLLFIVIIGIEVYTN